MVGGFLHGSLPPSSVPTPVHTGNHCAVSPCIGLQNYLMHMQKLKKKVQVLSCLGFAQTHKLVDFTVLQPLLSFNLRRQFFHPGTEETPSLIFGCRAQTYGTHIPCPGADGCGRFWFFDKPDQASAHTFCSLPGLNLPAGLIHRSRGTESEGRRGYHSVTHRQLCMVEQITHADRRYLRNHFPRALSPKSIRQLESGLLFGKTVVVPPSSPGQNSILWQMGRWAQPCPFSQLVVS